MSSIETDPGFYVRRLLEDLLCVFYDQLSFKTSQIHMLHMTDWIRNCLVGRKSSDEERHENSISFANKSYESGS